uniref:DUF3300 domain-containing protein n=1 Tax=uncultured bacterium fosmid pJB95A1 TaxID=1478075 RepID=A0A0H3UAU4_9BACT|nr:hypothetical protein [uncultured bacterium fosmid pJB95A1]
MMKNVLKAFFPKMMGVLLVCLVVLPTSANAARNFSSSELDTLVSTIALYPDPLLVHVLTASTYGEQIPGANNWAQAHKDMKGEQLAQEMEKANLPYDPSVQALIPFPTVLGTMAKYRTWSDQLGDAVSAQKDEVMDAVQRLRSKAYDYGQLKTNDQVKVEKGTTIVIEPVRTEYVYVPVYDPRVVFYVYADAYPSIRYHHHAWLGSWFGEWGWGSCWFEWDYHNIFVRDYRWYHHRPIPRHPRRYNPPPRRMEPVRSVHPSAPARRDEGGISARIRDSRKDDRRLEDHRLNDRRIDDRRFDDRRNDDRRFEDRRFEDRSTEDRRYESNRTDDRRWDSRNNDQNGRRVEKSATFTPTSTSSTSMPAPRKNPASGGNGGFTRVKR